jgi:hypothetical protein
MAARSVSRPAVSSGAILSGCSIINGTNDKEINGTNDKEINGINDKDLYA